MKMKDPFGVKHGFKKGEKAVHIGFNMDIWPEEFSLSSDEFQRSNIEIIPDNEKDIGIYYTRYTSALPA